MIRLYPLQSLFNGTPTPSVVADPLRPLVEIRICAYNPAGEVDCCASSQALTAGVIDFLSREMVLGDSLVAPV